MDLAESPLRPEVRGTATLWSRGGILPCGTIDNAFFELLLRGLEVGTRMYVLIGTWDESAKARVPLERLSEIVPDEDMIARCCKLFSDSI